MKKLLIGLVAASIFSASACAMLTNVFRGHGSKNTLNNGLVVYYPLEETSGTRADATNTNADLTDNNTVTSTTGKLGTAASFNQAASEYLHRPTQTWGIAGQWTIAVWVNLTTSASFNAIFQHGNNGAAPTNFTAFYLDGTFNYIQIGNSAGGILKDYRNITRNPGTWTHYVFTLATDVLKVYVDGSDVTAGLTKNTDNTGSAQTDTSRILYVGAGSNGTPAFFHHGALDEFMMWNRALTAAEVTSLYNGGTGRQAPFAP